MNTIGKVLSGVLITLIVFSNFSIVDAADNFDWDELEAQYEYDSRAEDLKITVILEDISNSPDQDYDVEVEINRKDYNKDMSYSSSRDELYARFYFDNIDEDDVEDYLDLEIVVRDEGNDRVFTGDIEMDSDETSNNDDNLDWDEVEVTYNYNDSSNRLNIKIELSDVNQKPDYSYTAYADLNNKEYDEKMYYSASNDRLYANFYIANVDEDEIEDYYDVELKIKDDEGDTVYDEDIDLQPGNSNSSSNNSNLDWSKLQTTVVYEKDKNRLNVRTQLSDIEKVGDGEDYDVIFTVDGKRYTVNMFYSQANKELYSYKLINVFSASRVKTSYNVKVIVEDEDNDEVYSKTKRITTNKNGSSTSTQTNTNTSTTSKSGAAVFAYRYIFKVEAKYSTKLQRTSALNKMKNVLEQARYSYSDKAYIDEIIKTIDSRIDSYGSSATTTKNTSTSGSSTRQGTKTNKAERTINDNSGSFKYYGGYNY